MSGLRGLGRAAEDAAASYLIAKGFTIVTRRYKARHGELDLVAMDGEMLVFVEVKHRTTPGARPEDAVGETKRRALVSAGQQYLAEVSETPDRPVRFDLVAIDFEGIRHHQDIFSV